MIENERPGEAERFDALLTELDEQGLLAKHSRLRGPDGRPVRGQGEGPLVREVRVNRAMRGLLREADLADLPDRTVGFYWPRRDEYVLFTRTAKRVRAAGLWPRLRAHEDFFHREGNHHGRTEHGLTHDEDAEAIVVALRDFRRLWWGRTVSEGGSAVSSVVLPLLATNLLQATLFQVSMLNTLTYGAGFLVGLPAAWLIGKVRKRPLMIVVNLFQFALAASIAVAALGGVLTLAHLYVVTALIGASTVVNLAGGGAYVVELVDGAGRQEANAALQAGASGARSLGPAAGSGLFQVFGAVASQALDALSYLVNAVLLSRIRTPDAPLPPRRTSVTAGLKGVFAHRILRDLALYDAFAKFFLGAIFATQVVFLVRELHAPGLAVGLVAAAMALGGWLGAASVGRLQKWIGGARVLRWPPLVIAPFSLLLYPFAPIGVLGFVLAGAALTLVMFMTQVRVSTSISYLQRTRPWHLIGPVLAAHRWVGDLGVPLGAALGGALPGWVGIRPASAMAMAGVLVAAVVFLGCSPLRRARSLDDLERLGGES